MKTIIAFSRIPLIATFIALSVLSCRFGQSADVVQAIKNDAHLEIASMTLYNAVEPSVRVSLTNSETLDYMTRALRRSTATFDSGFAKRARLTLNNHETYDVTFVVAPSRQSVAIGIGKGPFKDETFYGVELVPAIPSELREALMKMTAGDKASN